MGSGASVNLQEEKSKPLDLSDVMTPRGESIKTELIRVRTLLANTEFTPVAETPDEVSSGEPPAADEPKAGGVNFDPSTVASESEDDMELTQEEMRELRARRRNKTGPGTTRSGRKESVMTQGMVLSMAQTVGEVGSQYTMTTEDDRAAGQPPAAITEGSESQENSPMPPTREVDPADPPTA
mmetsp:Transcript_20359/g.42454  ORF Transcript_20359/g.42454 Transcript_20359/m.42454 type:complete len:182 (+) Transcript_20359:24-569(+)